MLQQCVCRDIDHLGSLESTKKAGVALGCASHLCPGSILLAKIASKLLSQYALGKFGEHSKGQSCSRLRLGASSYSYTFFVLSKLPVCSISRIRTLTHELIVNYSYKVTYIEVAENRTVIKRVLVTFLHAKFYPAVQIKKNKFILTSCRVSAKRNVDLVRVDRKR